LAAFDAPLTPESTKFPAFSLLAGNLEVRDGFARDCPLQRGVCELSVPELPSRLLLSTPSADFPGLG